MKDLKLQIPNLSRDEAKERIAKVCNVKKISLEFLGEGYEGFVFTDKKFVYKIFKPSPRQDKLYFNLSALSHTLEKLEFKFHYPFKVVYNNSDLIIYYKYLKSSNLHNANKEQFQNFLNEYYFANIVHLDLKPKNLCIDYLGNIFCCDIGYDLTHFTPKFFESMCRKAFVIYKLQNCHKNINIKEYLSPLNKHQNFSMLEKLLKCSNFDEEFKSFRNGIGEFVLYKKIITDFYAENKQYKTIFDYGSGDGKISANIQNLLKRKVYVYYIDDDIIKSHQENYTKIEYFSSNHTDIENLINKNKKFDSVLCSLVLCHPLSKNEKKRLEIIDNIMQDLCSLSKEHILIVICNPLFNNAVSNIQNRLIDNKKFDYSSAHSFHKQMFSSNRKREDIHRPLGFYEDLFKKYNLKIKNIIQSGDFRANHYKIINSDFMIFDLVKSK